MTARSLWGAWIAFCDRFMYGVRVVSVVLAFGFLAAIIVHGDSLGKDNAVDWVKWCIVVAVIIVAIRAGQLGARR